MGTEKCLLKAKESLLWPGISRDIKELAANCAKCIQFSKQQPNETLCPHSVPNFPGQKLGCDLFDYQGSQNLLVADYCSKYPHLTEAELDDICCYSQSSQVNLCPTWNTRIPGYRQWTPT